MNSCEISFTVDQEKINGHLVIPNEGGDRKPGIIFIHGMTSSEKAYLQLANDCAHKGIVGLTINMRGHEGSDGDFQTLTVRDLTNDGVAAYDFLARQEGIDTDRISICGTSVGAHVAMMVSAQRKVESLILRAPALYTEEMLGMTITEIMQGEGGLFHGITSLENTEALEIIKTFFGSVLLVVSENDQIIPRTIPDTIYQFAQSAKEKEMTIIPGATHALTDEVWRTLWIKIVLDWLTKKLLLS